jgi:hypothetical protein
MFPPRYAATQRPARAGSHSACFVFVTFVREIAGKQQARTARLDLNLRRNASAGCTIIRPIGEWQEL